MNDVQMKEHLIDKGHDIDSDAKLLAFALLEGFDWNIEKLSWERIG